MIELGFEERGGIYYHRMSRYTLEFPRGPLGVGGDLVQSYDTLRDGDRVLFIYSATDSVRDRLAAFYHWNDRSSLATAVSVALAQSVDLDAVALWSKREGKGAEFQEFKTALETARAT